MAPQRQTKWRQNNSHLSPYSILFIKNYVGCLSKCLLVILHSVFGFPIVVLAILLVYSEVSAIGSSKMKCQMNCDLQDYKPICGTNDAGETKTFPNLCVLKTENCLRTSSKHILNCHSCFAIPFMEFHSDLFINFY